MNHRQMLEMVKSLRVEQDKVPVKVSPVSNPKSTSVNRGSVKTSPVNKDGSPEGVVTGVVIPDIGVNIRREPSVNSPRVAGAKKDQELKLSTETKTSADGRVWQRLADNSGWVCISQRTSNGGTQVLVRVTQPAAPAPAQTTATEPATAPTTATEPATAPAQTTATEPATAPTTAQTTPPTTAPTTAQTTPPTTAQTTPPTTAQTTPPINPPSPQVRTAPAPPAQTPQQGQTQEQPPANQDPSLWQKIGRTVGNAWDWVTNNPEDAARMASAAIRGYHRARRH